MKKLGLLLGALLVVSPALVFGQLEKSIKLNEIMTHNTAGIQDEYGTHGAWIEIANISHTTYNVRGMYITTDRSVINPSLSAPERIRKMSIIPNGEPRTSLNGRQHLVFFCNSFPARGALHLTTPIPTDEPVWVALYNGNGVDLIDSVTVPVLAENQSFGRICDGDTRWEVKEEHAVTPGISNQIIQNESKIEKLKREDPHGFGITVLSMGIVFFCLALLFLFFYFFGLFMKHRSKVKKVAKLQPLKAGVKTVEKTVEIGHKTNVILQDGLKSKGIDREIYIAVIAMALKEYQDNVHDVESGIITIKPKNTDWTNEYNQMTQFHE